MAGALAEPAGSEATTPEASGTCDARARLVVMPGIESEKVQGRWLTWMIGFGFSSKSARSFFLVCTSAFIVGSTIVLVKSMTLKIMSNLGCDKHARLPRTRFRTGDEVTT